LKFGNLNDGDQHLSATNFFQELIPYLTTIILQDGPLWLKFYPQHEYSRALLNRLGPSYVRWARWAYLKIEENNRTLNQAHIPDLNAAAQGAFYQMSNAFEFDRRERTNFQTFACNILQQIEKEIKELKERINKMDKHITNQDRTIAIHKLQTAVYQQEQIRLQRELTHRNNDTPTNTTTTRTTTNTQPDELPTTENSTDTTNQDHPTEHVENTSTNLENNDVLIDAEDNQNVNIEDTTATPQNQTTATVTPLEDRLHNTPRRPTCGTLKLPKTMVLLYQSWKEQQLNVFTSGPSKKGWLARECVMFSKWHYLYKRMEEKANNGNFAPHLRNAPNIDMILIAAQKFDEDRVQRNNMSVPQYLAFLKGADTRIKKRKRVVDGI
jgi:hypothetical protein